MCPACFTAMAVVIAKATGAGTLATAVITKVRRHRRRNHERRSS